MNILKIPLSTIRAISKCFTQVSETAGYLPETGIMNSFHEDDDRVWMMVKKDK